ncbi:hypothetical protein F1880_009093 [Penicillium rolfsii]|nr:hypothetical protein F1880_009093 [Penicillium rolfsii]
MRFTSLAAAGLLGCAFALPGRHIAGNHQPHREIPTMTIDITEPGTAPSLIPIFTPIWSSPLSRRPIPTPPPSGDSSDVPDSIRQAQQKLYDDWEKGVSQEQLQADVDNIWSAEVAAYQSWLAAQTSISVPPSNSASAWPTPSGRPTSSRRVHFHHGHGGVRMPAVTTDTSQTA